MRKGARVAGAGGAESEHERILRAGYLRFLPSVANVHLLVLRAARATLGWDFSEDAWELFARENDLPSASTLARSAGAGSFAFAKFLAGVGPLPPHPGGSRFSVSRDRVGWEAEAILLGAVTVARINGGWPPRDRFDHAAQRARARGVEAPSLATIRRHLGISYTDICRVATNFAQGISEGAGEPGRAPATYAKADAVARGMAHAIELLDERPSSEDWDDATREYRNEGVPCMSFILRVFGSYHAAWRHVEALGLDPGCQRDARPRYTTEAIARGMATVEDKLGYRPNSKQWTDVVRELKCELGPGVIPAKPTIYHFFGSWQLAWACVDAFRRRGII